MNHKISKWHLKTKFYSVSHSWLQRRWQECHIPNDKKTFTTSAKCHRCVLNISARPSENPSETPPPPHSVRKKHKEHGQDTFRLFFFKHVKLSTLIKNNVSCVKRQLVGEKKSLCFGMSSWRSLCCFPETLWFCHLRASSVRSKPPRCPECWRSVGSAVGLLRA